MTITVPQKILRPRERRSCTSCHDSYRCSVCKECYVHCHRLIYREGPPRTKVYFWECMNGTIRPSLPDLFNR